MHSACSFVDFCFKAGFQEVLQLVMANGERDVLMSKVQGLERLVNSFWPPRKSERNFFRCKLLGLSIPKWGPQIERKFVNPPD